MTAPEHTPDPRDRIAGVLAVHRWKSMGVSSCECECGELCYGGDLNPSFPADEAFRLHIADAVLAVFPTGSPDA